MGIHEGIPRATTREENRKSRRSGALQGNSHKLGSGSHNGALGYPRVKVRLGGTDAHGNSKHSLLEGVIVKCPVARTTIF